MRATRIAVRLGMLALTVLAILTTASSQPFVGPGPVSMTANPAGLPSHMMIVLEPSVGGKPSNVLYYGPADNAQLKADYGVATTYLLGTDYDLENWTGSYLQWTTTNSARCDGTYVYQAATYPSGWDNRASSASRVLGWPSSCNHFVHWENTYWGGASIDCGTCKTMGVMNNASSSCKIYK